MIYIHSFRVMSQVCETDVASEEEDEEREVNPRRGIYTGEEDLEKREGGIETMLGDIGPEVEAGSVGRVEEGPVDDGYEEREGGDGCVEEVVECLEGSREAV